MQLSEHFTLLEFTHSDTAKALGIDNTPSAWHIKNMQHLCIRLLEPLRLYLHEAICISSGFRCPALNKAVGGAKNSQHQYGEAADIRIPMKNNRQDMELAQAMILFFLDHCRFDQLIWEHNRQHYYWLHISLCQDDSKNRQMYVPQLLKG